MGKDIFSRFDWVDTLKGIGIILVVAGHIFGSYISGFIYLFHMPLFFFLAGYLYSPKPLKQYLKNKSSNLLIPYSKYLLFFTATSTTYMILNHDSISMILKSVIKSLYGGNLLTGWMGVFWFITVFFITQQLFNFSIVKLGIKKTSAIAIISLTLSYIASQFIKATTPLNIIVTLHAFPFMCLGYLFKTYKIKVNTMVVILTCVICIWFFSSHKVEMKFDMKQSLYGIPFISFITALALVVMAIIISSIIKCKPLEFIGVNSMSIMYIHQFIHLSIANKVFESDFAIFTTTIIMSLFYCAIINKINIPSIKKLLS
ncbi:acyltransferase family protein [Raoultella terrigena]|uniref:acyltransferase family protein n=1 Tax=Raoultella terrigena TaxID=577 RepID=UPI003BAB5CB1